MLYMERRTALVKAIRNQMGEMLEVFGAETGMHLAALLPSGVNDVGVSKQAGLRGICAMPLSSCCMKPPARGGLVLGYGAATLRQVYDDINKLGISVLRAQE